MVRVSTKPDGAIIAAPPLRINCGEYDKGRLKYEYAVTIGEMSRKLVPTEGVVTFDIETGSLPVDHLRSLVGPFDPSEVKTGNLGPEKAKEKIETARQEHADSLIEKAALCATTGRTIAIGYLVHGSRQVVIDSVEHGGEAELIARFWEVFKQARNHKALLSGFNIGGFDVPFLIRRSWMLGADWPPECLDRSRYLGPVFHDLAERWALTTRDTIKLDSLCRRLGIGEKNGNGAEFARLWGEDRMAAVRYLVNDVHLEYRLGIRMGLPA